MQDRPQITAGVRLAYATLLFAWGAFLAAVVVTALPYNALSVSVDLEFGVRSIVPEGWGFFTRDPREPDLYLYRQTGDGWVPFSTIPLAHPRNLFGISRTPRAIPVELAALLENVAEEDWTECDSDFREHVAELPRRRVVNKMPNAAITGTVCVVSREPVPWAWASETDSDDLPCWVVMLEVECGTD